MKATVIIPTYNHWMTLNYSIKSVLNQTVEDIEVFIIGDGVPEISRGIIKNFIKKDSRIKFFDHPKDKRHGEIYRNEALKQAKGKIVCYLADDDLWLPDHIEIMLRLLKTGNFCHTYLSRTEADATVTTCLIDISSPIYQKLMMEGVSFIAFSFAAHTLALYKKLPYGWRTAPQGIYSDLYMWQQFLAHPECRPVSGFVPTVLYFPSPVRKNWSMKKRVQELEEWSKKIQKPGFIKQFRQKFLNKALMDHALINAQMHSLTNTLERIRKTKTWRLHELLIDSSFGRILRKTKS